MLIKRENLNRINNIIEVLKQKRIFSISTKYKFLKIQEQIKKEYELYYNLIQDLKDRYNGEIMSDGAIKFSDEDMPKINQELFLFNQEEITFIDLKFSLDELEGSDLSWEELEILMSFIK